VSCVVLREEQAKLADEPCPGRSISALSDEEQVVIDGKFVPRGDIALQSGYRTDRRRPSLNETHVASVEAIGLVVWEVILSILRADEKGRAKDGLAG
jgi:hypothetical protein